MHPHRVDDWCLPRKSGENQPPRRIARHLDNHGDIHAVKTAAHENQVAGAGSLHSSGEAPERILPAAILGVVAHGLAINEEGPPRGRGGSHTHAGDDYAPEVEVALARR
jgi:hypothetical protein